MRALLLCTALLLWWVIGGCVAGKRQSPATYTAAKPEAAASAWLDPQAQISQAVRLITPSGSDLRQAAYQRQGAQVRIIALQRDYSKRTEGVSDPQLLQLLPTGPGEPRLLDPGDSYLPLKLLASPSRQSFTLAAVKRGEEIRLDNAPLAVLQPGSDGALTAVDLSSPVLPLGYVSEQLLFCRGVSRRERQGGLVVLGLDWTGAAQVYDLEHAVLRPAQGVSFCANADRSWIAGYAIKYDPALPAQAQIEYVCTGKRGAGARWLLPYHVSYEPSLWEPPLLFADLSHLVTTGFRPDTGGRGERANYKGLFRIESLDAATGEQRVIEDRILPYLSIAASAGLVFYPLRVSTEQGPRWEVWVAAMDGIAKQRIWSTAEAEFAAVEDALDGRRVLVQRQYLIVTAAGPELHSELLELSLDVLEQSTGIVQPVAAPAPAPEQAEPKAGEPAPPEGSDLFIPDEPGGGSGDDGGGTAPVPAPGGEGGTPPPIAVP